MAYYLTVYQGDSVSVPFKSKYNLTGFTFSAQFSSTADFASTSAAGNIVYNNGQFLLTLTASEASTLGSKYFRVRAVKSPDTYYIISGYINYVANTPSTITASDVDQSGFLKGESVTGIVENTSATVTDATSSVKGVILLSGDLGGTASAPTVPGLSAKYTKPGTGIPESDLASGVQTKLNSGGATVSDATTSSKGIIQLTGDLAGTATAPTVPGLAAKAPLASPTFTGTVSGVSKSMVGLGNVDNTSDANKPISTAEQTALNLKANLASPTFTGTVSGITATMVGLGNVNNTADTAKPVSTAQQTALDLKANAANMEGIINHDGSAGGGTRPSGYFRIRWVGGTARPTNMVSGDIWEHDA